MDLKLDEQKLLVDFRRLNPEGKAELLNYAAFLMKKFQEPAPEEISTPDNQCPVRKQEKKRPEVAKEPIFTE